MPRTRNHPPKFTRIRPEDRPALGAKYQVAYYAGSSIRSIAADQGRAYGTVHRLLLEAGTKLRPRGGATRRRPA